MIEAGNEEQALAKLEQALKDHPNDVEIRNYYLRHKAVAVQRYLQSATTRAPRAPIDAAEAAYQRRSASTRPTRNAQAGLDAVPRDRASQALVREAEEALKRGDSQTALAKAQEVLKRRIRRSAKRAPSRARPKSRRSRRRSSARSSPRR